jgi:hypothetical protein
MNPSASSSVMLQHCGAGEMFASLLSVGEVQPHSSGKSVEPSPSLSSVSMQRGYSQVFGSPGWSGWQMRPSTQSVGSDGLHGPCSPLRSSTVILNDPSDPGPNESTTM